MSLADRLADTRNNPHGLPCPIATILGRLNEEDRVALLNELEKPVGTPSRLTNNAIASALTEEGYRIGIKGVETHRKRACRCFTGSGR